MPSPPPACTQSPDGAAAAVGLAAESPAQAHCSRLSSVHEHQQDILSGWKAAGKGDPMGGSCLGYRAAYSSIKGAGFQERSTV